MPNRHAPLSPSGVPWMATHVGFMSSARPRIMDATDIRQLIRWHADAAVLAERAGFDILYVYAGMGYLPYQFLLSDYNHRTDAYGGSVRNRVRLVEELIDAVREATHGRTAVALRISLQELRNRPSETAESEGHEVIDLLKDAPRTPCSRNLPHRRAARVAHPDCDRKTRRITRDPAVAVVF